MLYIALRSRIVLIVDEWSLWLLRSSFWHEWCYFVKASQVLFSFRLFFHKWKSSLITDSLPYISIQIVLIKSWTSSQIINQMWLKKGRESQFSRLLLHTIKKCKTVASFPFSRTHGIGPAFTSQIHFWRVPNRYF